MVAKLATLNNWTPKRAHTFARRRLDKIEVLLGEVSYAYCEVDSYVESKCDDVIAHLKDIREAIDHSLAEGRDV